MVSTDVVRVLAAAQEPFISSIKSYRRGTLRPTSAPSDLMRWATASCPYCEQWKHEIQGE